MNAVAQPQEPEVAPSIAQAQQDKGTLERMICEIVKDYEARYNCRVSSLSLDIDRCVGGEWRTFAVKASVQL